MISVLARRNIRVLKFLQVRNCSSNSHSKQNKEIPEVKIKELHKAVGTFGDLTNVEDVDKHFIVHPALTQSVSTEKVEPLVIILGWAGATHKNLDKYSQVYRERGCGTLQYILPTRFIFRHTEQVKDNSSYLRNYFPLFLDTPNHQKIHHNHLYSVLSGP